MDVIVVEFDFIVETKEITELKDLRRKKFDEICEAIDKIGMIKCDMDIMSCCFPDGDQWSDFADEEEFVEVYKDKFYSLTINYGRIETLRLLCRDRIKELKNVSRLIREEYEQQLWDHDVELSKIERL